MTSSISGGFSGSDGNQVISSAVYSLLFMAREISIRVMALANRVPVSCCLPNASTKSTARLLAHSFLVSIVHQCFYSVITIAANYYFAR